MKKNIIYILSLVLISCTTPKIIDSNTFLPNFESNYDSIDFVGASNKKLIHFSKDKDFVFASSYPSFFGGYTKRYEIVSFKNGCWSCYKYNGYKQYGRKILFFWIWKKDSIEDGRFHFKREVNSKEINKLINKLNSVAFWTMNQDSINFDTKEYRKIIADASTTVFDIIKGTTKKSLSLHPNVRSKNVQNKQFQELSRYYNSWWYKNCH